MLEAVVNISEGRDARLIDAIGSAAGPALLDIHRDPDHHRSVFTIAARDAGVTEAATRRLTEVAFEDLDLRRHSGVHPRLGVVDVVPFVALGSTPPDTAIAAARAFADWLARTHRVPTFFYDLAAPGARTLPTVRREAFRTLTPDRGPETPDPRHGATAVGARRPMIAVNVELSTDDVVLAKQISGSVRERDGGLPGVRALGMALASRATVQVSMNLVDLDVISLERACVEVRRLAEQAAVSVERVELVGLMPASELARSSADFRRWSGLDDQDTIEARLAGR